VYEEIPVDKLTGYKSMGGGQAMFIRCSKNEAILFQFLKKIIKVTNQQGHPINGTAGLYRRA
jgi:hypothetical protein